MTSDGHGGGGGGGGSDSGSITSSSQRNGRSKWIPLFVAAVAICAAIWYRYPQPTLDENNIRPAGGLNSTVIAITGATSGIGLELATKLHGWGATILAIGRSPSKLERLRTALDGEGDRRLIPFVADLKDLASVAKAADEIKGQYESIDVLVNNAGIHYGIGDFFQSSPTAQGIDVAFGVNYLSHFLLTEKLLPLLQKSERNPRIIQVSSSFHWLSGGDELSPGRDGLPYAAQASSAYFHALRSYPNSKLAQILHARALSRELAASSSHVRVVSVCPGWVGTKIGGWFNHKIMSHVAFPPDGFGLSSILWAMFEPLSVAENTDWVVNSRFFHQFGSFFTTLGLDASWTSATGFRDLVVWTVATTALYTQKFFGEVIWSQSSPESFDVDLQGSLFRWSRDAVSDWL